MGLALKRNRDVSDHSTHPSLRLNPNATQGRGGASPETWIDLMIQLKVDRRKIIRFTVGSQQIQGQFLSLINAFAAT